MARENQYFSTPTTGVPNRVPASCPVCYPPRDVVERVARAIAGEFHYGFVFDWTERLTGSPGTEEMYDRNYWRAVARKALQAAFYTSPTHDTPEPSHVQGDSA